MIKFSLVNCTLRLNKLPLTEIIMDTAQHLQKFRSGKKCENVLTTLAEKELISCYRIEGLELEGINQINSEILGIKRLKLEFVETVPLAAPDRGISRSKVTYLPPHSEILSDF